MAKKNKKNCKPAESLLALSDEIKKLIDSAVIMLEVSEVGCNKQSLEKLLISADFRQEVYEEIRVSCVEQGAVLNSYEENAIREIMLDLDDLDLGSLIDVFSEIVIYAENESLPKYRKNFTLESRKFDCDSWMERKIKPFIETVLNDAILFNEGCYRYINLAGMDWSYDNLSFILRLDERSFFESVTNLVESRTKLRTSLKDMLEIESVKLRRQFDLGRNRNLMEKAYIEFVENCSGAINSSTDLLCFNKDSIEAIKFDQRVELDKEQKNIVKDKIIILFNSAFRILERSGYNLTKENIFKFLHGTKLRNDIKNRIEYAGFVKSGTSDVLPEDQHIYTSIVDDLSEIDREAMLNIFNEELFIHRVRTSDLIWLAANIVALSESSMFEKGYLKYHENYA